MVLNLTHREIKKMVGINTKRIKRSCPGCLGICLCYGDMCACITSS